MAKPKFAVYWAASCGGCEIAFLDIREKIFDFDAAADLVFCPCLMDVKYADVEAMADEEIDVRELLRTGGSDHDLKERLLIALRAKPERHHINTHQFRKCQRNMSAIGG